MAAIFDDEFGSRQPLDLENFVSFDGSVLELAAAVKFFDDIRANVMETVRRRIGANSFHPRLDAFENLLRA